MDQPPSWRSWLFELSMYYDRPVTAGNLSMRTRDFLITAWQLRHGVVELAHPGGRLRAAAGDWVLIPPGTPRRHRFGSNAAIRSIRCAWAGEHPLAAGPPLRCGPDAGLETAADEVARRLPGDVERNPIAWAHLHAAVQVWAFTACDRLGLTAARAPSDARVAEAQRLLLHPSPASLPWPELRAATGLSRPQLDRLFRRHCGATVRAWAAERLLADACAALGDVDEPVKAVADRLGFGDASHFCRWFRQHAGASPADWRRRGGT